MGEIIVIFICVIVAIIGFCNSLKARKEYLASLPEHEEQQQEQKITKYKKIYKRTVIGIICLVGAACIFFSFDNKTNIVQDKHFTCTRTEFIEKYDELYTNLYKTYSELYVGSYNNQPYHLDDYLYDVREPSEAVLSVYPNAYKLYLYDTTFYTYNTSTSMKAVFIITDKDDYVLNVKVGRDNSLLQTAGAIQCFTNVECAAAYMAITGETKTDIATSTLSKIYPAGRDEKDHYDYMMLSSEKDENTFFSIGVLDQ